MIQPTKYLQVSDISFRHNYENNSSYKELKNSEGLEEEGNSIIIDYPVHRSSEVRTEDKEFGYTVGSIVARENSFEVYLPRSPELEWSLSAHRNILNSLKNEFNIQPAGEEFKVNYGYDLTHDLMTMNKVRRVVPEDSKKVESIDEDWFEEDSEVYVYELPSGSIYLDIDNQDIRINAANAELEKEVQNSFSDQIQKGLNSLIRSYHTSVEPHPQGLFDKEILYPAFAFKPHNIKIWNSIRKKMMSKNLFEDRTPVVRRRVEKELGFRGHRSLLGWLDIATSIQFEIPVLGGTPDVISDRCGEDSIINWVNARKFREETNQRIHNMINEEVYNYSKSILDSKSKYLELQVEHHGVKIGIKREEYRPVINLKEDWSETDRIEDYFWATGAWWFSVIGGEPYDNRFSRRHVSEYLSNVDEFAITRKEINNSLESSHEDIISDMYNLN
jgi:hypothetical protein